MKPTRMINWGARKNRKTAMSSHETWPRNMMKSNLINVTLWRRCDMKKGATMRELQKGKLAISTAYYCVFDSWAAPPRATKGRDESIPSSSHFMLVSITSHNDCWTNTELQVRCFACKLLDCLLSSTRRKHLVRKQCIAQYQIRYNESFCKI